MNMKPWFRQLSAIVLTIFLSLTLFSLPANAFVSTDYDHLLLTNECNGCNLTGADLSNKDLYGSALLNANLTGANLSGALLTEAKLKEANLSDANLSNADLSGVTLSGANLTGANFSCAVLYNALIDNADLSSAILTGADLEAAIISDAKLSNAVAQKAVFNKAILSRANLSHGDFSNASMRNVRLSGADLTDAQLSGADLFRAIMPNDTIYNGDLPQTSFTPYPCPVATTVSLSTKPTSLSVKFDKKVRLGITPTGWSNSDDLTMDLNPPISYKQIISEIALSGFKGLQGAPKFPKDVAVLKKDLEVRGLTISEPWVGTYFTIGAKEDSEKIFADQMAFMKNFDSNVIVVAELGGAVHQQPIDPLGNRPKFTDAQWKLLIDGLNSLGDQAYAAGMVLCYHPHVGTGVENRADIDRLMDGTKDHHLYLLLDTGHLYYSGVSQDGISDIISTYGTRIKHVHLKNIRQPILDKAKQQKLSFLSAIRDGVFTVPGDQNGVINFDTILQKLAAVNYEGWLMVEAEQDPNNTTIKPILEPFEYAVMAREYLRRVTGL